MDNDLIDRLRENKRRAKELAEDAPDDEGTRETLKRTQEILKQAEDGEYD